MKESIGTCPSQALAPPLMVCELSSISGTRGREVTDYITVDG